MRHALVRPPGSNFTDGLTTARLGLPDLEQALAQHAAYCEALEGCGLSLTRLEPDPGHPDSTFVEDTAVLTPGRAVLTRPGAPSRLGEVAPIRPPLARHFTEFRTISAPGTLDGGDVCEADGHFLIGISHRTNEAGARELAAFLAEEGRTSAFIDIRDMQGILHLKSGIAWVGDNRIAAIESLAGHPALREYEIIPVDPAEAYAANCIRVNDRVLIAAGHPRFESALRRLLYDVVPLEMSEFEKMDGGLSCLSLRF
jgi:dimethylargininase